MMFHLDVLLLPNTPLSDNQTISAFVEMKDGQARSIISIAISAELLEHLARQLDPSTSPPSPAIIQDIACEISNIIGNHVRSYLDDSAGINLIIGIPKAGLPTDYSKGNNSINMRFRIRENDGLDLGFMYLPQAQRA